MNSLCNLPEVLAMAGMNATATGGYGSGVNDPLGIYTPRMHSIVRGTGTPKDRDEVNKGDSCE